jgi:hypothetical protein
MRALGPGRALPGTKCEVRPAVARQDDREPRATEMFSGNSLHKKSHFARLMNVIKNTKRNIFFGFSLGGSEAADAGGLFRFAQYPERANSPTLTGR